MTDRPLADGAPAWSRRSLLAIGGLAVGGAAYGYGRAPERTARRLRGALGGERSVSRYHVEATTAVAEAVYPSSVSVDESFVEEAVFGRVEPRPGHLDGTIAAVEAVDGHARARFGAGIADLSPERRRDVLASIGATEVHPTPDGTTAERVRFYLVNDLLYVLFTSPRSSDFTGIENPPGHPGGREAYRRGVESE